MHKDNDIIKSSTRINNLTINSNYYEITMAHQKIHKIIKINNRRYNYDALLQKGKERTVFWNSRAHGLFDENGCRIKTMQEEKSLMLALCDWFDNYICWK